MGFSSMRRADLLWSSAQIGFEAETAAFAEGNFNKEDKDAANEEDIAPDPFYMDVIADINSRFMKDIMNPNTTDRSRIVALTDLIKGKSLEMSEISKGKTKHRNEIRTLLQEYISLIEDGPEDFLFKAASRGWEDDEDWKEREPIFFQQGSLHGSCAERRTRLVQS